MSTVLLFLAIACMLATLGTLFAGIITMGRDTGKEGGMRSNKLMRLRVILQGASLLLIVLWWFTKT